MRFKTDDDTPRGKRRFSDREEKLAMQVVERRCVERGFVTSDEARRIVEKMLGRTTHPTLLKILRRHGYIVSGRGPLATWSKDHSAIDA